MSDMELGEIEGEKIYNPKDVVWVKLSGMWWPAEVQDQETLDPEVTEGLKKPPLCVVQFLLESSYLHIKSLDQIYHYNCKKKMEFLKLGYKKYFRNKNEKNVSIWPDVIQEAERCTGGNPDIINDPEIVPVVEKPEVSLSKPGPSVKRSSLPSGIRRGGSGSRSSLPAGIFSDVNGARQETKSPSNAVKSGEHHIRFYWSHPRPPVDEEPELICQEFYCEPCDLRTVDLERFIIHFKLKHVHIASRLPPPRPKPRLVVPGPSKPKKEKKRKQESASPIIKKKKKKSVVANNEQTPQPKKKKAPPSALEVSQECEQILKDWDDEEEDADKTTPPEDIAVGENSTSQVMEEPKKPVVPFDKNDVTGEAIAKTVKTPAPPPKSASCFDFDDEEPSQPEVQTLKFGQKLPRVISPEKSKSSATDLLSDGRELESFLNEVSVPVLPVIPSTMHAGSSLKEMKGGKKSVASPAREIERKLNDVKECTLPPSGDQNLEDKKTAASEDGEVKSEEKHFLVEGPLQSKKRKGSGLTEGAEDGSADKKLKCHGVNEPSKKDDVQMSGHGHMEKIDGQLITSVLEPETMVLDKLDEAATITVESSDLKVAESPESVNVEILIDPNYLKIGSEIPPINKSTISELDKQSLIDTLTYSPSSVDTDSSQKKNKHKSPARGNTQRGNQHELEDGKGDIVSELDKQSLIDTLTHSPAAPVESSTSRKKKSKQDQSKKKSPKTTTTESSKTPDTSNLRCDSADGGSPSSRSRSSKSRGVSFSLKEKHSEFTPSREVKLDLESSKSRKSRHSRLDRDNTGSQDLTGKIHPMAGGNEPLDVSSSSITSPNAKKMKISKPSKSSENDDKKSSPGQASKLKRDASIEKTEEKISNDSPQAGLTKSSSSEKNGQQDTGSENVVSSRLRSKTEPGLDGSPSSKSLTPPGIDSKKREAVVAEEPISKKKAKSENHSEDQGKAKNDDLPSSHSTESDSSKSSEGFMKLPENSKIALEKNEFLEVSKLMPNERTKPSAVDDTPKSLTDKKETQEDKRKTKKETQEDKRKTKERLGIGQKDDTLDASEQAVVDNPKKKKSSISPVADEHVHKKTSSQDKSHKSVSVPLNSTKKDKTRDLVVPTHKKNEHYGKSSKDKSSRSPKPDIKRSKESIVSSDQSPSKILIPTGSSDARHSKSKRSSRSDKRLVEKLEAISSPSRSDLTIPDVAKDMHSKASTPRSDKGGSKSKSSSRSSDIKERLSIPTTPVVSKPEKHSEASYDQGFSISKRSSHSFDRQAESRSSPSKRVPKDKALSEAATPNSNDAKELSKNKRSTRSHDSQGEALDSSLSTKKSISTTKDEGLSEVVTPGSLRSSRSHDSHMKSLESSSSPSKNVPTDAEVSKNERHSEENDMGHSRNKRSSRSQDSLVKTQESVLSPNKSPSPEVIKDEVCSDTTSAAAKGHRSKCSSRSRDCLIESTSSRIKVISSMTGMSKDEECSKPAAPSAGNVKGPGTKQLSCSQDSQVEIVESISSPNKSISGALEAVEGKVDLKTDISNSIAVRIPESTLFQNESFLDTPKVGSPVPEIVTHSGEVGLSKIERSSRSQDGRVKTTEAFQCPSMDVYATLEATDEDLGSRKKKEKSSHDKAELKKGIDITSNKGDKSKQLSTVSMVSEATDVSILKEYEIGAHADRLVESPCGATPDASASSNEAVGASKLRSSNEAKQEKNTFLDKEFSKKPVDAKKSLPKDKNVVPIDQPVDFPHHTKAERLTASKETTPGRRSGRISSRDMQISSVKDDKTAKEATLKMKDEEPLRGLAASDQLIMGMSTGAGDEVVPLRRSMRSCSQDVKSVSMKGTSKATSTTVKPDSHKVVVAPVEISSGEQEKSVASNEAAPARRSRDSMSKNLKRDDKHTPKDTSSDSDVATQVVKSLTVDSLGAQPEIEALPHEGTSKTVKSPTKPGVTPGALSGAPPTVPELMTTSDSIAVKKNGDDPEDTSAISHDSEPALTASKTRGNEKGILISSTNETKARQPGSTPHGGVTEESTLDQKPSVKEVQDESALLVTAESPLNVKTEEQTEVTSIISTKEISLDSHNLSILVTDNSNLVSPMHGTCKSPRKESTSNQKPISSEREENLLEKDVPLSSLSSPSTCKPENKFKTPVKCPKLEEAPLQFLENKTPTKALDSLQNNLPIKLEDHGLHNLVLPSNAGKQSKAQVCTQSESVVGDSVFQPSQGSAIGSPKKIVPLFEENLQNNSFKPIPSSPQGRSLGLESKLPEPEDNKIEEKIFEEKCPSSIPCDSSSAPPEKTLAQTKLASGSISPEETKLSKVSEMGETKMLDLLPTTPLITARASRWDNPFPSKKNENRPSTPTRQLMTSPTKMSLSPVSKVKVEIKSGLGRSCFKSPPPEVKCDSTEDVKSVDPEVVQPPTLHQEVASSVNMEMTCPDQTTVAPSDFDDELSALQAEIASYSESKLQAYLPKPDPSDETKEADSLKHKAAKVDTNSREPKTDKTEEVIEKKLQNAGPPQVFSKQQIMDLENSLAFDIPLESIPLPECPKQPEVKLKEIPPPAPKVPGLSEAALLASLLKGDDDDVQIQHATITVGVASAKNEITKSSTPVAKNGQSPAKTAVFDKHSDNNKGFSNSKSNLLRPVVTSLSSVPVVISTIPLPLLEPSISSSQVDPVSTAKAKTSGPIVIPVAPANVSLENQVPIESCTEETTTSRVEILEVEHSQPQAGLVGGIDPSKLLDINDIPFVFEEDLIEEGLMPSEPSSMQSPIVTDMNSLNEIVLTHSVPEEAIQKNNIVSSTAIDSEETFAIEDLVEEVVEEEPATDSTLSGNVVTDDNFTAVEPNERKVYEARQVRQYFIEVIDDSDPDFEYNFSLPPASLGISDVGQTASFDKPQLPSKKLAKVVPIHPKRITSVKTEPKLVSLGSAGKIVGGVSSGSLTPQIIKMQTIKSGKATKNLTSADIERQMAQVAASSHLEMSKSKEPLKLRMVKDVKTGATKFMVKPHMVQQLTKSACKQLMMSQHLKNVVKSPASVVASNTLSTKNPSLIQISKSPVSSPRMLARGTSPSILTTRKPMRLAGPRASSIPIQRPTRTKTPSEVLVSSSTVQIPIDHSGLILTNNNALPESSTNQVLLSSSANQLVFSSSSNQQTGTKYVSFLVNKPPEPTKKPGKDLLEQALTGLDVQNDEAPTNIMPTATVVYGMLSDPIQHRPIMTTTVQPSQVILSPDQLLAFQTSDDPSSTVSNSETNR